MTKIERTKKRIAYYEKLTEKLENALEALVEGGVQSYTIDDRTLTRFDVTKLREELDEAYLKLEELEAQLQKGKSRKAVAAVPRDW